MVLIDELDVHLHPKWQRRVCSDLKKVFPNVQFLGTTHSPQVIGGVKPEEIIRLLPDGSHDIPSQSYGMDSNWILEVLMDADKEEPMIKHGIETVFNLIGKRQLDDAQAKVVEVRIRRQRRDRWR